MYELRGEIYPVKPLTARRMQFKTAYLAMKCYRLGGVYQGNSGRIVVNDFLGLLVEDLAFLLVCTTARLHQNPVKFCTAVKAMF